MKLKIIFFLIVSVVIDGAMAKSPIAYDMEMAQEICAQLPLENVEGVWSYPEDKVTVLILREDSEDMISYPYYTISVVDTSDARLHPGEIIGKLQATAKENEYLIELSTEKKNEILLKPKSVTMILAKEGDSFLIHKQKSPFKGKLNFNFSRLLPGFWKIVSFGISQNGSTASLEAPAGMIKLYPSYDGNGSSRRKVRYL